MVYHNNGNSTKMEQISDPLFSDKPKWLIFILGWFVILWSSESVLILSESVGIAIVVARAMLSSHSTSVNRCTPTASWWGEDGNDMDLRWGPRWESHVDHAGSFTFQG